MNYDITFLHTGEIHVATFEQLLGELNDGIRAQHIVDEELLNSARQNGITPDLEKRIDAAMLKGVSDDSSLVVCTCSSIGGVAEGTGTRHGFKSMRIDRAMADEAVDIGNRILVLAALESTLEPTAELIKSSAERKNKSPEIELKQVDNAWPHFESGDLDQYSRRIGEAIVEYAKDFDVVVLAQASMSKAVDYCEGVKTPVLSSPRIGVKAALAELKRI